MFYSTMVAIQNVECQKHGSVGLFIGHSVAGNPLPKNVDFIWKLPKCTKALPIRFSAVHFCLEKKNTFAFAAEAIFKKALDFDSRMRFRAHYGKMPKVIVLTANYIPLCHSLSASFLAFLIFNYCRYARRMS